MTIEQEIEAMALAGQVANSAEGNDVATGRTEELGQRDPALKWPRSHEAD